MRMECKRVKTYHLLITVFLIYDKYLDIDRSFAPQLIPDCSLIAP